MATLVLARKDCVARKTGYSRMHCYALFMDGRTKRLLTNLLLMFTLLNSVACAGNSVGGGIGVESNPPIGTVK